MTFPVSGPPCFDKRRVTIPYSQQREGNTRRARDFHTPFAHSSPLIASNMRKLQDCKSNMT